MPAPIWQPVQGYAPRSKHQHFRREIPLSCWSHAAQFPVEFRPVLPAGDRKALITSRSPPFVASDGWAKEKTETMLINKAIILFLIGSLLFIKCSLRFLLDCLILSHLSPSASPLPSWFSPTHYHTKNQNTTSSCERKNSLKMTWTFRGRYATIIRLKSPPRVHAAGIFACVDTLARAGLKHSPPRKAAGS